MIGTPSVSGSSHSLIRRPKQLLNEDNTVFNWRYCGVEPCDASYSTAHNDKLPPFLRFSLAINKLSGLALSLLLYCSRAKNKRTNNSHSMSNLYSRYSSACDALRFIRNGWNLQEGPRTWPSLLSCLLWLATAWTATRSLAVGLPTRTLL